MPHLDVTEGRRCTTRPPPLRKSQVGRRSSRRFHVTGDTECSLRASGGGSRATRVLSIAFAVAQSVTAAKRGPLHPKERGWNATRSTPAGDPGRMLVTAEEFVISTAITSPRSTRCRSALT